MFVLDLFQAHPLYVAGIATGLSIVYTVSLVIYRLYFSPIAKFPGPRLAAATLWYEFYYDVIKGGQYTFKIGELHKQYGPVLRINPYEIHIKDSEYYDEIYTGPSKPREKWPWSARMFGNSTSHFGAISHEWHRTKRAPLNPFFSKKSVAQLQPMIDELIEKLCDRCREFQKTQEPMKMRFAFGALTSDVITTYGFGRSWNSLDDPDFAPQWTLAQDAASELSHMNKQFPSVPILFGMMPLWVIKFLNESIWRFLHFRAELEKHVRSIREGENTGSDKQTNKTIFHELLKSDLPASEKAVLPMVDEGQTVIGAGQVTTTHYLNTAFFHIISNPHIYQSLKEELITAMPNGRPIALHKLEQLPYLSSVVLEGFRRSYGVTHRLQRISPHDSLTYSEWIIPAGTPVGMTSIFMHDDPNNFPDPRVFKPERWLDPKDRERLQKYLVNFSRGTRSCLGQDLARAEIYLTIAALFRRFDLELYQTTQEDIDVVFDFFNPSARTPIGLRVIVK